MSNRPDEPSDEAHSNQLPKRHPSTSQRLPVHPLDQDYDDTPAASSGGPQADASPLGKKAGGVFAGFVTKSQKSESREDEEESAYFASKPTAIDTGPERAYRPLLKPSLYLTLAAATVMILANVASSSSAYGTTFYTVSNAIFRTAAAITAAGLILILIAFRIPSLQRASLGTGRRKPRSAIARILISTPLAIIGLWMGMLGAYWLIGTWSLVLLSGVSSLCLALLVTMALWHQGVVRGFAIGVLTVQILNATNGLSGAILNPWLLMSSGPYTALSGTSGQLWQFGYVATASTWTAALLAGALCSVYVWFVERSRRATDSASPPVFVRTETE